MIITVNALKISEKTLHFCESIRALDVVAVDPSPKAPDSCSLLVIFALETGT